MHLWVWWHVSFTDNVTFYICRPLRLSLSCAHTHILFPCPCGTDTTYHDHCHSSDLTGLLSYLHGRGGMRGGGGGRWAVKRTCADHRVNIYAQVASARLVTSPRNRTGRSLLRILGLRGAQERNPDTLKRAHLTSQRAPKKTHQRHWSKETISCLLPLNTFFTAFTYWAGWFVPDKGGIRWAEKESSDSPLLFSLIISISSCVEFFSPPFVLMQCSSRSVLSIISQDSWDNKPVQVHGLPPGIEDPQVNTRPSIRTATPAQSLTMSAI